MSKKSSGDYDGWILRLLDKAEDILHSYSMEDWIQFASDKIEAYNGYPITANQADALAEYRSKAWELTDDIGVSVTAPVRYRTSSGKWSSEKTEFIDKTPVYRNEKGQFMKRGDADALLTDELKALGHRKK